MTRAKAIQHFCVDCIGGSPYDTPLCPIEGCPLWEYRLGCGIGSNTYIRRVRGAWARGGETVKEAKDRGKTLDSYLRKPSDKAILQAKSRRQPNGVRKGARVGGWARKGKHALIPVASVENKNSSGDIS